MKLLISTDKLSDVLLFGKVVQKSGWEHNGRNAARNVLVYVTEGNAVFNLRNEEYELNKDCIFIIPKGEYYTANTNSYCEYYFLHFSADITITNEDTPSLFGSNPPEYTYYLSEKDDYIRIDNYYTEFPNQIKTLIYDCQNLSYNLTGAGKILMISRLYEIFSLLSMINENKNSYRPKILDEITEYIKTHYNSPLSLSDLSAKFGVSKSYIARLFKIHLNTTAVKYIIDYKLDHSRELMINSNMSITEICEYLGFGDRFYFSKLFKEKFLVAPGMYRKEHNIGMQKTNGV